MELKSLLVVLLTDVALSSCHHMDPNLSEAKRQAIFKETLWTSEGIDGMLRGRLPLDAEKLRAGSAKLHQLVDQPWQYLPSPKAGEEDEDARTKNEVWQRRQEFKTATQVFIDAMNRLQDNTRQATLAPDGVRRDFTAVEGAYEAYRKKFRTL